ncbi:hypothetical protein PF005_g14967 [Phytophthora fragariae]|uniref:Pectate lyase n=1 Tax=Phytophthora fragariae TaxID=53985 RepID=A0A6A3SPS6_9STRA|nr:hypothetical protein PF003_g13583 [Phytophthora fragariae]KAE8925257.1 hypothetical protein PF009_g24533 [Phytophthora fragariae]KAE9000713.1 hypothetical protein PF011_g14062 [Phytophthora fragariae]KAE9073915.1 hypothetical protein PF010_g24885 [Phytophthora fragariae]KAE9099127.1 hypothetical protein PF006_g23209 [Phytophthora fragariae]
MATKLFQLFLLIYFADKTSITVLHPGVYAVGVLVNYLPAQTNNGGTISLLKNGVQVQCAATGTAYYNDGYNGARYTSHQTSTSLMCIAQVEKDEFISVVCTESSAISTAASYLTVVRIGA